MSINTEINRLLNFARQQNLIEPTDKIYSANRLIDLLHVAEFVPEEINENLETATPILENMLDYAVAEKLIDDTVNERDLFDTRIMDVPVKLFVSSAQIINSRRNLPPIIITSLVLRQITFARRALIKILCGSPTPNTAHLT